ncbi:hypothetical protein BJ912DRAFT_929302 [Pholiota molesta]|nr:hypothetical protein BJ912DRAFT_929302 [Pholiota molesta]
MPSLPDPIYWEARQQPNKKFLYYCIVCRDGHERELYNVKRHEASKTHQSALRAFNELDTSTPTPSTSEQASADRVLSDDAIRHLLASLTANPNQHLYPPTSRDTCYGEPNFPYAAEESSISSRTGINWLGFSALEDSTAENTPYEDFRNYVAEKTLDFLNGEDFCDPVDTGNWYSGSDDSSDEENRPMPEAAAPNKRARLDKKNLLSNKEWYPWQDRITCSLDILMHLPRSVFSRQQLDLFLWLLRVNKVDSVPSVKSMNTLNKIMQGVCGIDTVAYNGRLGHRYHVNNLGQILAQEMCNPKTRSHLHFYPEDSAPHVSETRQADRWLKEVRPEDLTPMIRIQQHDYYVFEPAMLNNRSICIPHRWFTRDGQFYAMVWMLEERLGEANTPGWVVHEDRNIEVSASQFLKNFRQLAEDFRSYGIPDPSFIIGVHTNTVTAESPELRRWTYTNPVLGNPWRARAQGHRTLCLPLWLYCDDTSGNTSKKWNEHNSFLCTLAGLPLEHSQKEYNVHFLSTSNLAPPLEMMEGVVDQIKHAQKEGIWAWDCIHKEPVLIFPTVHALLGDNPMHSEFACHIGLRGKYFCRICDVKGTDAADAGDIPIPNDDTNSENSPSPSVAGSDDHDSADSLADPVAVPQPPSATGMAASNEDPMVRLQSPSATAAAALTTPSAAENLNMPSEEFATTSGVRTDRPCDPTTNPQPRWLGSTSTTQVSHPELDGDHTRSTDPPLRGLLSGKTLNQKNTKAERDPKLQVERRPSVVIRSFYKLCVDFHLATIAVVPCTMSPGVSKNAEIARRYSKSSQHSLNIRGRGSLAWNCFQSDLKL